jgi:hypothetical protein
MSITHPPDKKMIFHETESQNKSNETSLILDTSMGNASGTQEFIGYKALIGKNKKINIVYQNPLN